MDSLLYFFSNSRIPPNNPSGSWLTIFLEQQIPTKLNKTYITLVLKCANLKTVNNYRPVSLCQYQIIDSDPIFKELLILFNVSFSRAKEQSDNISLVQEVLQTLNSKKKANVLTCLSRLA